MSLDAAVAVLSLEELTNDEFRLLMTIAQTSAAGEDFLFPKWEYVLKKTGFTLDQASRILRGLQSQQLVCFGSQDVSTWMSASDTSAPLLPGKDLGIWIKGMAEIEGMRRSERVETNREKHHQQD